MIRLREMAVCFALALGSCVGNVPRPEASVAATGEIRIASWNLEFLAEHDGSGCRPRKAADYAEMRQVAESLNADVIAFQEAENASAAARVFNPAVYDIVMEERPGRPGGDCGGAQAGQTFIRQAVGFAVRKGFPFVRAADLTALEVGNDNLRSGVDITVQPPHGRPIRLLAIHLKSGCFSGSSSYACPTLAEQMPIVAKWVEAASTSSTRFIVLGDWNRRLAQPGDPIWAELDDGSTQSSKLNLTDKNIEPHCDARYHDFIDHIVLDARASSDFRGFREAVYASDQHPSDHCPIIATLAR